VLYFASGGGVFDAPLVFAGWGISPADHAAVATQIFSGPSFGKVIEDWPDDYKAVDVRGKIAVHLQDAECENGLSLLDRDPGLRDCDHERSQTRSPSSALHRSISPDDAADDQQRWRLNPYKRLGESVPIERIDRPPVIVLSLRAAERILGPLGVSPTAIWDGMQHAPITGLPQTTQTGIVESDDAIFKRTLARDLGVTAHLELPVERVAAKPRSLIGTTGDAPRILVWAVTPGTHLSSRPALDALASTIRALAARTGEEVAFVVFDRTADAPGNARQVAERLGRTNWDLIVVLDDLEGERLRFDTNSSDLIPAFDEYAERSGARAQITRGSAGDDFTWPGSRRSQSRARWSFSGPGGSGDLRADAAALLGYIAGRDAADAPELRR
jgi:hypothetical protein